MRSLFLSTSTNETDKYCDSLRGLNLGECEIMRYDIQGLSDELLYSRVKEWKPDFIAYIGGVFGKQPSTAALANITNRIAPMVLICSDAADIPWHEVLRRYNDTGAFALQVAIDGSHKWPNSGRHMTALTPVVPLTFPAITPSHEGRGIRCGFAGNGGGGPGSKRTELLGFLLQKRILDLRIRSNLPFTYESYCDYLTKCRISLNTAYTGTEATTHVKGRVLESGLAGACLLETKGSPTSYWFRPGLDYIEYESPDDAANIINRLSNEPEATEAIGESLRRRILSEHSPSQFWHRIFGRIGMKVGV